MSTRQCPIRSATPSPRPTAQPADLGPPIQLVLSGRQARLLREVVNSVLWLRKDDAAYAAELRALLQVLPNPAESASPDADATVEESSARARPTRSADRARAADQRV